MLVWLVLLLQMRLNQVQIHLHALVKCCKFIFIQRHLQCIWMRSNSHYPARYGQCVSYFLMSAKKMDLEFWHIVFCFFLYYPLFQMHPHISISGTVHLKVHPSDGLPVRPSVHWWSFCKKTEKVDNEWNPLEAIKRSGHILICILVSL